MNILVLSRTPNSYPVQCLAEEAKKRRHSVRVIDPVKLYIFISRVESGYDRLYDGYYENTTRINIKDIDVIIPRIGDNIEYASMVVEHLNKNLGIYSTQTAEGIRNAANKFKTLQKCSCAGIRTPRTILAHNPSHIDFLVNKVGGLPVVVKLLSGSRGKGVTILETKMATNTTLESFYKAGNKILIQEYIHCDGKDIRAIVIGGRVVASYLRVAPKGDFRSNLSIGGTGTPIKLSEADKEFSVQAAQAINLDVAGVDLIKDQNGNTYLSEINSNFGFRVQRITGVNIAAEILDYAERMYDSEPNTLDDQVVEERNRYLELLRELEFGKEGMQLLLNDRHIKDFVQKNKGQRVFYKDRNDSYQVAQINSVKDIQKLLIDCFRIIT